VWCAHATRTSTSVSGAFIEIVAVPRFGVQQARFLLANGQVWALTCAICFVLTRLFGCIAVQNAHAPEETVTASLSLFGSANAPQARHESDPSLPKVMHDIHASFVI
jgi:hypothetical protein